MTNNEELKTLSGETCPGTDHKIVFEMRFATTTIRVEVSKN